MSRADERENEPVASGANRGKKDAEGVALCATISRGGEKKMKGIIMAIAIAAGMALGGAASGQTQEEVNEIIRRAQQIRIADRGKCGLALVLTGKNVETVGKYYASVVVDIKRDHGEQVHRAKVSDTQLMEAVCRYMNDMK